MDILPAEPVATNRKWYELWLEVWKHPSDTSFKSILNERDHEAMRGFIWIGVSSLIAGIVAQIATFQTTRALLQYPSGRDIFLYVCGVIIFPIAAIIGMMISAGIFHLIAKIFHGNGKWSDLVYCFSAITAPSSIIVAIGTVINFAFVSIQILSLIVSICIIIIYLILAIYSIVLYINAIKSVENIGTGPAVATYFIPTIILLLIGACIFFTFAIASSTTGGLSQ